MTAGSDSGTVFVVAESFERPNSGGRIRSLGIATALASLGPLEVLALDDTARDDEWGEACRAFDRRGHVLRLRVTDRLRGAVAGNLRLLERMTAAGGVASFDAVLGRVDASAVVLSVPFFGGFVSAARARGMLVIADAHESLVRANWSILRSRAALPARLRAALDLQEARRFEPREYARVDQVWVASSVEQAHFRTRLPTADLRVIPNLAPGQGDPEPAGPITAIGFVGSYGYAPNEEAAIALITTIAPAIRRRVGPMDLVLIGRDPTRSMREQAGSAADVRITGTVPDAVAALRECGVLVVPLRAGAGSRIKILEAMQAGIPVVTTAAGLEGLDAQPGREVLSAETPAEFADAVDLLRSDSQARAALAYAASAFVWRHHSQPSITAIVATSLGEARQQEIS